MTRIEAAHILGISPQANEITIKKAFRKKAMQFHPDRNKSANARTEFIEIHEAYEYLMDLATGKISESYSKTSSSNHHQQTSRFRSEHHKHRNYTSSYHNMSKEEFEERFNRARQAAEDAFERRSNKIYQDSLDEYQTTWRHSVAKAMSIFALLISLLFILDYSLGLKEKLIPSSQVNINSYFIDHFATLYIEINGQEYKLPHKLNYLFKDYCKTKSNYKFSLKTTHIFKDIVGVSIQKANNKVELTPLLSVYGSFPLVPILLLIPFLSLWFEKATFNFVFFIVNYNIYIIPIFLLILLFHDGRLYRLLSL